MQCNYGYAMSGQTKRSTSDSAVVYSTGDAINDLLKHSDHALRKLGRVQGGGLHQETVRCFGEATVSG